MNTLGDKEDFSFGSALQIADIEEVLEIGI